MQEFIGLAYFAEIPGGDLRRAARQPVDRHADEDAAGRPPDLRLRVARRHEARAAVPRGSEGMLRDGRAGVRSRRSAADAGVRDDGPRHRHAGLALRAVRVGRQPPARSRQGDDGGGARGRARISAATSTSTATAFRIAPIRARIRSAAAISRAARRRTATRATPRTATRTSTTCSGCCASSRPAKELLPAPVIQRAAQPTRAGAIWFGSTGRGDGRVARRARRRRASTSTRCASARFRSPTRSPSSSPRTITCSSSSRTATRSSGCCWSTNAASIRRS